MLPGNYDAAVRYHALHRVPSS